MPRHSGLDNVRAVQSDRTIVLAGPQSSCRQERVHTFERLDGCFLMEVLGVENMSSPVRTGGSQDYQDQHVGVILSSSSVQAFAAGAAQRQRLDLADLGHHTDHDYLSGCAALEK